MKKCKKCGNIYNDSNRFCNECGSNENLFVCNNCKTIFDSGFCPDCGVKAGDVGKICMNCKTTYFSSFCPECGSNEVLEPKDNTLPVFDSNSSTTNNYTYNYIGDNYSIYETTIIQPIPQEQNRNDIQGKAKNKWIAFFLCLFFGFWGAHKFYEGKIKMGWIWFFTLGLFGLGWFINTIIYLFKPNPYYV